MIGIRLSSAIRLHYLRRLFSQSIHVLDSMPPGYAVSTITSTSNVLQIGISEKLGVFVEFTALIIAAMIVAFTKNWELSLVTFSGVIFILIITSIFLPLIMKGNQRMSKVNRERYAVLEEAVLTIKSRPMPKLAQWPVKLSLAFAWSWHVVPKIERQTDTRRMLKSRRSMLCGPPRSSRSSLPSL